jgi:hypothetical protein
MEPMARVILTSGAMSPAIDYRLTEVTFQLVSFDMNLR